MTQIMTPSAGSKTTTAGQIDKAVANYRALLEKHAGEFDTEAVQTVLGQSELAGEQLAIFRRRVEAISSLIVRRVKVDRSLTSQQALDATGRKQYTNRKVVDSMPKGKGDETETIFFKPEPWEYTWPGFMSDDDLEKCFERRNLKAAPPDDVAAANKDDSTFGDTHPNATHWRDADGNWCFAAFRHWDDGGRYVNVDRHGHDWDDHWWFAGLRK